MHSKVSAIDSFLMQMGGREVFKAAESLNIVIVHVFVCIALLCCACIVLRFGS